MFKNNQGYLLLILIFTTLIIAVLFVLHWAPQENHGIKKETPIKRALDLQEQNNIRVDKQNKELQSLDK